MIMLKFKIWKMTGRSRKRTKGQLVSVKVKQTMDYDATRKLSTKKGKTMDMIKSKYGVLLTK